MKLLHPKFWTAILTLSLLASTGLGAAEITPVTLLSLGRMNEAISLLSTRVDPESFNLLSRAYYATEQWDEAVKWGERAVGTRPDDAEYHLWLARAYGRKAGSVNPLSAASMARKAKTEFERAVQLNQANVQARVDLAQYYTEAPAIMGGGLDKAREQAAQTAKYDRSESHVILARIAEKEKRFPDAELELQQAAKLAPNPSDYLLELASFYRERGQFDDMQKAVLSAMHQSNAAAETYFGAAQELYLGGRDFPNAVRYLQAYLASSGMVETAPAFRAHYLLGQIYQKMGNDSAAATEYQASLSLASGFDRARKALNHLH